jgi:DNA-binding transcriptional ArsR family regulator
VSAPKNMLLLATLDRAARHSRMGTHVSTSEITGHLAISARSGAWRQVRRDLRTLESAGLIEQARRNGVSIWGLTDAAREQLRSVDVELGESLQHRRWREAHASAGQLDRRFRRELADALRDAEALLVSEAPVHSDVWDALGDRLREACAAVCSTRYCLYEWAEPDDRERDEPDLSRARFVTDLRGREAGGQDA